jgi:PST family polysaccharide transporter
MTTPAKDLDLVRATVQGTIWVYISQYSGQIVQFISTIILVRLLLQDDFGVAGYALLIMRFMEVLQGLGIRQALIYHDENPKRTATAFWLGLSVGLTLLVITLFVMAPLAGWFFKDLRAVSVTRALAFTLPISSLGLVHNALLRKKLAFNRQFIPQFGRAFSKGLVSIILALLGFGAWSLIYGQLAGVTIGVIIFWGVVPWRPSFRFRREFTHSLLSYGLKIVSNALLATLLVNFDYLLIGHYMSAAILGVYTLAFRIPELLIKQFGGIVGKVLFPVYVQMRDDISALRQGFLYTLQYVNIVTIPLGLGLALVAKPFVLVFFGEKWVEAIPVMTAISLYTLLRAMVFNLGDVYKAQGRPGLLVQIQVGQTLISIPALWWAAGGYGTITAVAWTQVVLVFTVGIVKLIIGARVLNVPFRTIVETLHLTILGGALMSLAVLGTLQLSANRPALVQLIASIVVGGLVYGGTLWWLQQNVVIKIGHTLHEVLIRR